MDGGIVYPSKGINFPGIDLNMSSLTEKDIEDIKLGCSLDIDWVAHSFVRTEKDYDQFIKIVLSCSNNIPVIDSI